MDASNRDQTRARLAAPAVLATVIFLWIPHGIHARNAPELGFGFIRVLPFLLAGSAATLCVLLWIGSAFEKSSRRNAWLLTLNLVAGLAWVQYALIGWNYGPLDGRTVEWSSMARKGVIDASGWLVVLGLGVALAHRVSTTSILWLSYVLLTTFALSSAVTLHQAGPGTSEGERYVLDESKTYRFSSSRNVIVVLWDEFQANLTLELLDAHPELLEQLDGFKVYRNALGGFKATAPSVPYLLSGEMFDNSSPFSVFRERSLRYASTPSLLKVKGYAADLVPWYPGTFRSSPEIQDNLVPDTGSLARDIAGAVRLFELALFSASPHFLKSLTYAHGEWYLSAAMQSLDGYAELTGRGRRRASDVEISGTSNDRDLRLLREMAHGIHITDEQPVFKFFHFRGAHTPFNIDRLGGRIEPSMDLEHYRELLEFKLYLMTKLIEILENAGIYDSSLIVFTGDHGSGRSPEARTFRHPQTGRPLLENLDVKARATPFLAVKFPRERGRLRVSDRPVSLGDVKRMILEGGDDFVERRTDDGVRRFVDYTWSEGFSEYLADFREYVVTGNPWLDEAWTPYHLHLPGFDPRDCLFSSSTNRVLVAKDVYAAPLTPGGTLEIEVPRSPTNLFALIQLSALTGDLRDDYEIRVTQGSRTHFSGSLERLADFQESIGVKVSASRTPLRLSFESTAEAGSITVERVVWLAYEPCSDPTCTGAAPQAPIAETRSASAR